MKQAVSWARLQAEGVAIATSLEAKPWDKRFFQVTDPNGIVVQLVQWVINVERID